MSNQQKHWSKIELLHKSVIERLLTLNVYEWQEEKFNALKKVICANDIAALEDASKIYDAKS